jgi:PAS domain S-box-containing protein
MNLSAAPDAAKRGETLHRTPPPDSPGNPCLSHLTRLSAELLHVPVAVFALLDGERTWLESGHGVAPGEPVETPSCLVRHETFVVVDTRADPQWAANPPRAGGKVLRAIAGAPLCAGDGRRLGALCVMAPEPRTFPAEQLRHLESLAAVAAERVESHRAAAPLWMPAIRGAAIGMVILDDGARIVDVNPCGCLITGYERAELAGHALPFLFPEDSPDAARLECALAASDADGGGCASLECVLRRKDGILADVRFHVSRFTAPDGVRFRVAAMEDVTALRRADEKLRHAARMESVGRLAGGAAHGFNNLLTIITGYGQLLQNSLREADPAQAYVEEIARAADGAAALAGKLLAFSRRRLGEPRRLDLNVLARQAATSFRIELPGHLQLVTGLDPEPLEVVADRTHLLDTVRDLLVNACEAMPRAGRINLRTAAAGPSGDLRPGSYALLEVEDEGRGIDPETQKHLFEPFYSTKGIGRGTGLATAYGTLRQCGGDVEVVSDPGRGTLVRLLLPLAPGSHRSSG